jgi:hypothetical protein
VEPPACPEVEGGCEAQPATHKATKTQLIGVLILLRFLEMA